MEVWIYKCKVKTLLYSKELYRRDIEVVTTKTMREKMQFVSQGKVFYHW